MNRRTILITGGSRGIGAAIAREFAAAGDRVAVHYSSAAADAHGVVDSLTGSGHIIIQADLRDPDAIKAMVAHNPKMKFAIVTEDVKTANQVLPEYPAYHESVAWDFVAIKNAKYVICGASTFACWPLWLSETLEYCIAPKYWFDFNRSQGWWSLGCSIYSYPSHYMDRSGNLFTPDECRVEWEEYKKTSNIYEDDL